MSSTTNTRMTWRQKEAEKARLAKTRHIAKTEENFPTTLAAISRAVVHDGPGMAERILDAHIKEEVRKQIAAYRASMEARERRNVMDGVFLYRGGSGKYQEEEEEEELPQLSVAEMRSLQFPGHGKRGYCTEPDMEGWRLVTRRLSRKRELTDAEMERKWRADILNEEDEEQADYNGELSENGQRREFY
jgi:hypothetical protein